MNIQSLSAAMAPSSVGTLENLGSPSRAASPNFGGLVLDEVERTNDKLLGADRAVQEVALGSNRSLHSVMIELEEARLGFQLLLQVRNRALEAYQEVMRTQL